METNNEKEEGIMENNEVVSKLVFKGKTQRLLEKNQDVSNKEDDLLKKQEDDEEESNDYTSKTSKLKTFFQRRLNYSLPSSTENTENEDLDDENVKSNDKTAFQLRKLGSIIRRRRNNSSRSTESEKSYNKTVNTWQSSEKYLSKSEEYLNQINNFPRNSSDSNLNHRKISSWCHDQRQTETVELRNKTTYFTRAIRKSVRSSLRLVRTIRPHSDSDVGLKDKKSVSEKYKLFRQVAQAVLDNPPGPLYLQPPAPLVVEDPPSTDDEALHDLRSQNPAFLNGSSGNFGSAGPKSAPATPQGQLGAPPGGLPEPLASPTIQRSPSHTVFTKFDKNNLKQLSTSTPTMTAQGQLAEPPSPKAVKDPKVHTTSKARQKKFLRHFPNVEEEEKVLNHYSCALIGDILLQGHLYITKNYFAFYSNVFGYVTKLLIPILTVEEITKEKTARIIPNAVGITTNEDKHIFGSLMSRDSTLAYMKTVWQKAKSEEALPELEITEPDQDSSESGESGRESPVLESVPSGTEVLATAKFDRIRKESVLNQTEERKGSKGFVRTLKDAITEFRQLPRQSLILVATTLLLILLFLSAAVLLYRINKIQNKYSLSLHGSSLSSTSEDIYSDLLQWQTHLHSRSADAVNNFLDNNLDQIAKVRQSLEALSTLLTGQNAEENVPQSGEAKAES